MTQTIAQLQQKAAKKLAKSQFQEAAELLANACELYASEHGEEDPDLLLEYGKALFEYAKSNSTMFNNETPSSKPKAETKGNPNIQLLPDAPGEDEDNGSEDEDEVEGDSDDGEPEQDDFAAAWSIIDLARVLLEKRMAGLETDEEKVAVKKQLADIYGTLGEISLEDDNHPQAVEDYSMALELKQELYDAESRIVCEAHYWLGLTYEAKAANRSDQENALKHMNKALEIAKACKIEPSVLRELKVKAHGVEQDLKHNPLSSGDGNTKTEVNAQAVKELVSTASDISSLVKKSKKRKLPEAVEPESKKQN